MDVVVRNTHTRETDLCSTNVFDVPVGQKVIFETRYGPDLGTVIGEASEDTRKLFKDTRQIIRIASESDEQTFWKHDEEAKDAERICREQIEAHQLKMNLVSAHYLIDKSKLLFFFSAEHRVDFRALVRDLVSRFHMRVELRQIGVRDESRMIGGMGSCGRALCCAAVSDRLAPVSIRMAKNQNYSLNSMKVSGPCGRLLCCLAYEHEFYENERSRYPREGQVVLHDDRRLRVMEVNYLSKKVRLLDERDGAQMILPSCVLSKRRSDKQRGGNDPAWCINAENCPPEVQTAIGIE